MTLPAHDFSQPQRHAELFDCRCQPPKPEKQTSAMVPDPPKSSRLKIAPETQPRTRKPADRSKQLRRTRRHLAEVAVRLFEQKGYTSTNVEEIAAAAEYSPSTFFRLFSDKAEVLFYDSDEDLQHMRALLASAPNGNLWSAIRNACVGYGKRWDDDEGELGHRRLVLIHKEPQLHARYLAKSFEWEAEIARLLTKQIKASAEKEIACRVFAAAVVSAFRVAWRNHVDTAHKPLAECAATAFDQLERMPDFFLMKLSSK